MKILKGSTTPPPLPPPAASSGVKDVVRESVVRHIEAKPANWGTSSELQGHDRKPQKRLKISENTKNKEAKNTEKNPRSWKNLNHNDSREKNKDPRTRLEELPQCTGWRERGFVRDSNVFLWAQKKAWFIRGKLKGGDGNATAPTSEWLQLFQETKIIKRNSELEKCFIILTNAVGRAASTPNPSSSSLPSYPLPPHPPTHPHPSITTSGSGLPESKLSLPVTSLCLAFHPGHLRLDPANTQNRRGGRGGSDQWGPL